MITNAYLYKAPREIEGLYDSFLGGIFLLWGLPVALQLTVFLAFLGAVAACVKSFSDPRPLWPRLTQASATAGYLCSTLLTFQPWDELFTNLRHAENLATHHFFSYNRSQAIEGSVDFLFYALVGLGRSLGIPSVEGAFILSVIGGLLVIAAFRQALRDMQRSSLIPVMTIALSFFAPLLFNASSGFSASFYAAAILWSLVLAQRGRPSPPFFFLLAVVPLIRFEGIYWTFLATAYFCYYFEKRIRPRFVLGLLLALTPFILLSLWRLRTFGTMIPNPALYKSTLWSPFFWGIGFTSLVSDLVSTMTVASLFSVALFHRHKNKEMRSWLAALGVLGIFVLPYYLTGGDWFPSYWGRFLLPFTMVSFFLAVLLACEEITLARGKWLLLFLALVAFAFPVYWPLYSLSKWNEMNFGLRWILANPRDPSIGKWHARVHYLSQLGRHLKATTVETDVVASSELSTVMYYADREALDMLGVANPEIAHQPLRTPPSLWRKLNGRAELPYRIFRRTQPGLIEKYRPTILFTFDFVIKDIMPDLMFEELNEKTLSQAVRRWERRVGGLVDPLYGGFDKILALGYSPIVIVYPNKFCSLYFVHERGLDRHLARMKNLGMSGKLFRLE